MTLPNNAMQPTVVAGEPARHDLDRHVAAEPDIPGAIDLTHAARAERRDDLVRAEAGTRREAQEDLVSL